MALNDLANRGIFSERGTISAVGRDAKTRTKRADDRGMAGHVGANWHVPLGNGALSPPGSLDGEEASLSGGGLASNGKPSTIGG